MNHVHRQATIVGPQQLRLTTPAVPKARPHDLVIRPDAVGICGTDMELLSGQMAYLASGFATYPIVPGHEWTGIVTEVGDDVGGFAVGDRVVGECSIGCGRCINCVRGGYHLCPHRKETGFVGQAGALATDLVFPSAAAHRVPDSVSAADAALVEPLAVAYRGLSRLDLQPGEALGVVGAGTIGLLCGQAAHVLGVTDVHMFDTDPSRREFAAGLGFTVGEGPEIRLPRVIEASGSPSGLGLALDLCLEGGRLVLLGLTGSAAIPVDIDRVVLRDLEVHGSVGSPNVWPEVITLLARGTIRPSILVSHEFSLDEVATAFQLAGQRKPGVRKILVRPNREAAR